MLATGAIARVKKCWVCGDKGTGFNYDALSCESCKVFFHRNASKPEKLKCRKDGNCAIDFATRKSCTKCRLEKCFAIGMKWKPANAPEIKETNSNSSSPTSATPTSVSPYDMSKCEAISELLIDDEKDTVDIKMDDGSNNFPKQISPTKPIIAPKRKKFATDLNIHEREMIAELQNALAVFEEEHTLKVVAEISNMMDMINLPALYIKRAVKFCKNISAFRCLNQDDQMKILKPFFMEMLSVRFTFHFDVERNGHYILENEVGTQAVFVKAEVCQKNAKNEEAAKFNLENGLTFKYEMENDFTIRDLIIGQLLFKPREDLDCPEFTRYYYYLYCRLLWRYLEHKYKSKNQANRKYTMLMNCINKLDEVKCNIKEMCKDIDLNQVSHVLLEIYGLNK